LRHRKECTRIAREPHDDIGQRLALLTIELEQPRQDSPDLPAEVHAVALVSCRAGLARSDGCPIFVTRAAFVKILQYLGLAAAIGSFCKEFSEQQDVEVVFAHDEVPYSVSQDISLCLLRVLQEALQNAVKHSGGGHFDAELRFTSGAMYLSVRDWGPGFDVERAMKTMGLASSA